MARSALQYGAASHFGAFMLALASSAAAAPVAMISDLRGAASLVEAGKSRPAALLAYLEPGTALRVESGARLVLTYFSTPTEVTLAGPAEATVGADGVAVSRGAKPSVRSLDATRAATAKKFESVQRDRLALATVQMRAGAQPRIVIEGPNDTRVYSVSPALSWNGIPGIASYRVTLRDAAGKILVDRSVDATSLTLDKPSLRHGAAYDWRVEAKLPSGRSVSGEAKFSVLDNAAAGRIARARPDRSAPFSERVLFAARLESEGLGYEAKREWRTLSAERPDDATLREWAER